METLRYLFSKIAIVMLIVIAMPALVGCQQVENQVVRLTGAEGTLHAITLVNLMADGSKYDGLNIGVGGYLGPNYLGPATSLYFVPEHVTVTDPTLGIWLTGTDAMLDYENICENIGTYVLVFGKYNHQEGYVKVDQVTKVQPPNYEIDDDMCRQLTALL